MFLAQRPSSQTIDRFIANSRSLPISYAPIGLVRHETARTGIDEAVGTIGRGDADFERAKISKGPRIRLA